VEQFGGGAHRTTVKQPRRVIAPHVLEEEEQQPPASLLSARRADVRLESGDVDADESSVRTELVQKFYEMKSLVRVLKCLVRSSQDNNKKNQN
jgi:hypothetical protein